MYKKEYEQIVRTPFVFSVGKTCFMEDTPCVPYFFLKAAIFSPFGVT